MRARFAQFAIFDIKQFKKNGIYNTFLGMIHSRAERYNHDSEMISSAFRHKRGV